MLPLSPSTFFLFGPGLPLSLGVPSVSAGAGLFVPGFGPASDFRFVPAAAGVVSSSSSLVADAVFESVALD